MARVVRLHALGPRSANCPRREVERHEPVVPIARSGCRDRTRATPAPLNRGSRRADTSPVNMDPDMVGVELPFVDMLELHESLLGLDEIDELDQIDLILDAFEDAAES